jgi:tetratricopeptide (TPR) repeat protein
MRPNHQAKFLRKALLCLWWAFPLLGWAGAGSLGDAPAISNIVILEVKGTVEIRRAGAGVWDPASPNQVLFAGDRLRTRERSHATLSLLGSPEQIGAVSEFEIEALPGKETPALYRLWRGVVYFFHRERPVDVRFNTTTAAAAIRGTEFVLAAEENGRTVLTMLDGEVLLSNKAGQVTLKNGEQGLAEAGKPPSKTEVLEAVNVIQWCLYYPGVLDLNDLPLDEATRATLAGSLTAYRRGNLPQALAQYPAGRQPASDMEKVYLGALLLTVGQVGETETLLASLGAGASGEGAQRAQRLAGTLRQLIATVKFQVWKREHPPELASEWLTEAYYRQARGDLPGALEAARKAAEKSPTFGFGWERVAELEFGFGRTGEAAKALETSLALAPDNAQALALRGFLFSARNRMSEARASFERAITTDGALGNAWLGRGLCKIRAGDTRGGLQDLETAAALEPNRSLLRGYLGKGFAQAGDPRRAAHELELARRLDPQDPTSWLYAALLNQQQNRFNEGIKDLEKSLDLNDNRLIFRSREMLDKDRAVRSSGLAPIYHDAGMAEVSEREAVRAVTYDYANYSAHQFLAQSYEALRDPTRFNLRYETLWLNEWLLANLLSPVGGTPLAQNISQQEYARLFEKNRVGFNSSTEYRSDGQLREIASQYGNVGNSGWALDLDYQHNDGVRPNNDLDRLEWYSTLKQQITPDDSALVLIKYENYHSGDNFQYYDPAKARPHFRFDEYEDPIVMGAWHHEWAPGVHTMVMGGRIITEQHFSDLAAPQLVLVKNAWGAVGNASSLPLDVAYQNQQEVYSADLNQICQWHRVTLTAGGRFQTGSVQTQARLTDPPRGLSALFDNPAAWGSFTEGFERLTGYGYLTVEPLDRLWLTGGLAYDDETYPRNFRQPPLSGGQDHVSQLGPKGGVVWSPLPEATLRGAFARSLGGLGEEENFRLEPTQLAGIPQAFRNVISESVVGSVSAPENEVYGVALDLKFPTRTYVGLQAERLTSQARRTQGVFSFVGYRPPFVTDSTPENLDYRENSVAVSVNQLAGNMFMLGAGYRFTRAELHDVFSQVPVSVWPSARSTTAADLQQATVYVVFNHPSGFFARAETVWYHQDNTGYTPALPGDDFFQHNFLVGYRFARRRAEILFGILNLGGQDYRLNPLTIYAELPRERTFVVRVNFQF